MAKLAFAGSSLSQKLASRASVFLAGLVLLAAAAAVAAPWAFSPYALRTEVVARIREMTGLEAISQGKAALVVLPRPHVSIDEVGFADPSGALRVETRHLEGYLRLDALLTGRLEIARVLMSEPLLLIDMEGSPMPPDSAIGRAAHAKSATPQASSADEARLGILEIEAGSARLSRDGGATTVSIESIDVTIDWPKLGAPAHVTGSLAWNGERTEIDAVIDRPVELIRGEPSRLDVDISAPVASLSFDGVLTSSPTAQLNGRLLASVPSGKRLAALAGASRPLPAPFDAVVLSGEATIGEQGAIVTGLGLSFDGNAFEGALALRTGARGPVLSGTLATGTLTLEPFLKRFPSAIGRDGQWSRVPLDATGVLCPDLDLRVSATRVTLGRAELGDAAFSVLGQEGRLDLALTSAKAARGFVKGRLSVGTAEDLVELRANVSLTGMDLAASPARSSGGWRIGGSMTGNAHVESRGATIGELVRNLDGQAELDLSEGEFRGIDLERALRRLEHRPLALATEIRRGATAFDTAKFDLRIADGIVDIVNGSLRTPLVDLDVGGTADLGEQTLNLRALATAVPADRGASRDGTRLRFDVVGSFDDPVFLPDVRSLIRRSGAAAPLLRQAPELSERRNPSSGAIP